MRWWRSLIIIPALASVVGLGASAPGDAATDRALHVELSTQPTENARYQIALAYRDGYALNTRAPKDARLVLALEDGRRFHAAHFSHEPSGARLALDSPGHSPPRGNLTALLCKQDRCKKVVVSIDWRSAKTH